MDLKVLLVALLMALGSAWGIRIDAGNAESHSSTTTLSLNNTLTVTEFMTTSTTTSTVTRSTATAPEQNQDSSTFSVFAFNPGTPIHLLWLQAAGSSFWLGGEPATYCPSTVHEQGGCPPGNYTALSSCGMSTEVPGGQQLYATPDGHIGYTMAHSVEVPNEAMTCPFAHYSGPGAQYGLLTSHAFGALDLMACPTTDGYWKVVLALNDADTPTGDFVDCMRFDALTLKATHPAAWQYT